MSFQLIAKLLWILEIFDSPNSVLKQETTTLLRNSTDLRDSRDPIVEKALPRMDQGGLQEAFQMNGGRKPMSSSCHWCG